MVANWSKFSNGKFVLSPTLDIAKDFELNNPNYEVIAAVNGDFFMPKMELLIMLVLMYYLAIE